MNVLDWLDSRQPGFRGLSQPERDAIMHFSLLWSLFEAKALNTRGSANAIMTAAKRWSDVELLSGETFREESVYFRKRYYADGSFTHHFDCLNLREANQLALIKKVIKNDHASNWELAAGILIIVYRLRNNFFHGAKWAYEIRGQLDNFSHANSALMRAITLTEMAGAS